MFCSELVKFQTDKQKSKKSKLLKTGLDFYHIFTYLLQSAKKLPHFYIFRQYLTLDVFLSQW